MKVVLTGGAGFLGAWITRRLLSQGAEVRIFDTHRNDTLLRQLGVDPTRLEWIVGDITSSSDVELALAATSGVIHLAGILTPACSADPVLGARVNLLGTLNVFEAAKRRGLPRVVYSSSAGVFGSTDGRHPHPETHYGAFKLACEGSARAYWHDAGLTSVGFRPFIIYGPGRETGSSAGPTLACRAAARGEVYTIPFTGRIGLNYVEDVAALFVAALTADIEGASVYTLGGDVLSTDEIIELIGLAAPGARIDAEGPPLPIVSEIHGSDPSMLKPGWRTTPPAEGLAQTVTYYRE
jgi:nucleoside-diphosphate-sugar epimerase